MSLLRLKLTNFYCSRDKTILFAFFLGMAINLVSIYVGNPYIVSLVIMTVAVVTTIKWMDQPLPWIVLVSVVAANPVNLNASIALNLLFAIVLLFFKMRFSNKLPNWIYLPLIFAFISILGSTFGWSMTGAFFTQISAVINYVIGPFFLIPLIYFRLQDEVDNVLILKMFVFSLMFPSIFFMFLARLFGAPDLTNSSDVFNFLVNINIYSLWGTVFHFTRTQVGIPLAILICASFAVSISSASSKIRLVALTSLLASISMLMVTGSVGSSLSALCGILLILVCNWRYISIKKYLIMIPFFVLLSMVVWSQTPLGVKNYVGSRYEEKLSTTIDTSDRSGRWESSLGYLMNNPLGRGWDLYVEPIHSYPHNDYISYGIAFGLVCGFLYLFFPVKILLSLIFERVSINDPTQSTLLLVGIGSVTVLLVNSFADHLVANRWYFNVSWSIVWYCFFSARTKFFTKRIAN